ncbi:MAG: N-acetyltransferase [Lachnospiraceae bacterium]|nr:N-acetyltransferase [Lachnospiraceae bacterium]
MENGYTYRLETPSDYAATEALTRDAFWNVYQPGCDEHFIVHRMRGNPAVVEHLNYVCLDEGVICGHIFYTRTKVVSDDGRVFPVLSFGPLSVAPDHQHKGIGSYLIRKTMKIAAEDGFTGVLITGNPKFYHRFGFQPAANFGIVSDEGSSFPELMACELDTGRLEPVHGRLFFCTEFSTLDQEEVLLFDQKFPPRERHTLPGKLF